LTQLHVLFREEPPPTCSQYWQQQRQEVTEIALQVFCSYSIVYSSTENNLKLQNSWYQD